MQNEIFAISPLDGRYANKVQELTQVVSEAGLIKYRIKVEAAWLLHLADEPEIGLELSHAVRQELDQLCELKDLESVAVHVKDIEATTNHDVKAVEYFIRERLTKLEADSRTLSHIHFGCTSEDINNVAYALMLQDARQQVIAPTLAKIVENLQSFAAEHRAQPMLSYTHGQPATPTTLGKEFAVFAKRLSRQLRGLQEVALEAKINGAVGAFNAHVVSYPQVDWVHVSRVFIEKRLGLMFNPLTTQIENHDSVVEYCDALRRCNTVLLDLARDVWSYISKNYLGQKSVAGEVGSSTMPHKVNPIDFENAEGNLGLAAAISQHFSTKLPVSRLQRDLSDSTVLRNLGSMLAYSLLSYKSLLKGLGKVTVNSEAISKDLNAAPEVLAEVVQMCLRRYGVVDAYEQLKAATRGKSITLEALREFVQATSLPTDVKTALQELTPDLYIGLAPQITADYLEHHG